MIGVSHSSKVGALRPLTECRVLGERGTHGSALPRAPESWDQLGWSQWVLEVLTRSCSCKGRLNVRGFWVAFSSCPIESALTLSLVGFHIGFGSSVLPLGF